MALNVLRNTSRLFVCLVFLFSCGEKRSNLDGVEINWENDRAVSIVIPKEGTIDNGDLRVTLSSPPKIPIIGNWSVRSDHFIFRPLTPLTPDLTYYVFHGPQKIYEVQIPKKDLGHPNILSIFPIVDTVPANLLKMYIRFSTPMGQENPLDHMTVLDALTDDTLKGTFLDLHPALWNTDQTLLTLWLDPGRIKRDLVPNKEKGVPLEEGNQYRLIISDDWKAANGMPLSTPFEKGFVTTAEDRKSPEYKKWHLVIPKMNSTNALKIIFDEPLDQVLVIHSITVIDEDSKGVAGKIVMEKANSCFFTPARNWKPGVYRLKIHTRLEDLAGNNLRRIFDHEISQETTHGTEEDDFVSLKFQVED